MILMRLWRPYAPLFALLVFPVMAGIYSLLNKPGEKVYSLVTDLDRATPFLPVFSLPYAFWIFYLLICLVYFYRKDPRTYYITLVTYVICALMCYGTYIIFQTTVPRPEIVGSGPFEELMRYLYQRDQPFNCFPSIHCFSSYLMMKALHKSGFGTVWNRIAIYSMSLTIIASTLFVKQHVILDALSAILLVECVYWAVDRMKPYVLPLPGRRRLQAKVQSRM